MSTEEHGCLHTAMSMYANSPSTDSPKELQYPEVEGIFKSYQSQYLHQYIDSSHYINSLA